MLSRLIDAIPDLVCFKDTEGRWCLANRAACRLLALEATDWPGKTDEELAAVADAGPATWLRQCAAAERAAWQHGDGLLELEITESTVMHNTVHVSDVLDSIRQLGVLLAIDDFGTGCSSLSHLKRLPLDKLKIDQSFVHDLPYDEDDAVITRTIRALGHNLGLTVVAGGVESERQHAFLREIGCDEAQGYHYGKPFPAGEFTALLRQDWAMRT